MVCNRAGPGGLPPADPYMKILATDSINPCYYAVKLATERSEMGCAARGNPFRGKSNLALTKEGVG